MRRILFGAACLLVAAQPAAAGMRTVTTNTTVTTTSGNCLAQNNFRLSLALDASAASANIGYCLGASCTAVIGVVGTTTLGAATIYYWPAEDAPADAICFISASGSQPLTIREGVK